jgi:transcription elongation factor Elf1
MVTFECPWCAEPAIVDVASFAKLECEHCSASVEIATDPILATLGRAA